MNAPQNQSDMLVRLLGLRARYHLNTSSSVYAELESAVRHGGVRVLVDRHGRACGYVTFANLSKESFVRFRHRGELPRNAWEWNEGRLVVVADCMWKNIKLAELLRQLRETVDRMRIVSYRRNNVIKIFAKRKKIFRFVEVKVLGETCSTLSD